MSRFTAVCGRGMSSRDGGICGPQQQQEDCDRMKGVAGCETDVDEVRKEGGKTVLEKSFAAKSRHGKEEGASRYLSRNI